MLDKCNRKRCYLLVSVTDVHPCNGCLGEDWKYGFVVPSEKRFMSGLLFRGHLTDCEEVLYHLLTSCFNLLNPTPGRCNHILLNFILYNSSGLKIICFPVASPFVHPTLYRIQNAQLTQTITISYNDCYFQQWGPVTSNNNSHVAEYMASNMS